MREVADKQQHHPVSLILCSCCLGDCDPRGFLEILLRSGSDSVSEDWARNDLIDLVKRIHVAFDPIFVDLRTHISAQIVKFIHRHSLYLKHKLSNSFLCLLTGGIVGNHCALSRSRGARRWRGLIGGVRCVDRIGIHQKHEFHIPASEKAVDVVVLERVYPLQVPMNC